MYMKVKSKGMRKTYGHRSKDARIAILISDKAYSEQAKASRIKRSIT